MQSLQCLNIEVTLDAIRKVSGSAMQGQFITVHSIDNVIARAARIISKDRHTIG